MKIRSNQIKGIIAIISGAIGGFFGLFGGPAGAIVGIISGILVGYYYGHFTLRINNRHVLARIFRGSLYGTTAGLLSGISVHIPSLFMKQEHSLFGSGIDAVSVGAVFGIIVGTFMGFIIACFIDFIRRRTVIE
jgi:F0F1-type ATP synthase assembly protein I